MHFWGYRQIFVYYSWIKHEFTKKQWTLLFLFVLFFFYLIQTIKSRRTHKLQTKALYESGEITTCVRQQPRYYEEGADCTTLWNTSNKNSKNPHTITPVYRLYSLNNNAARIWTWQYTKLGTGLTTATKWYSIMKHRLVIHLVLVYGFKHKGVDEVNEYPCAFVHILLPKDSIRSIYSNMSLQYVIHLLTSSLLYVRTEE